MVTDDMKKFLIFASLIGVTVLIDSLSVAQKTSKEVLSNGYSVDQKFVYYRDEKLDIDRQGFEVLSEHWIKNNEQVYFMFTPRNGQELHFRRWFEGEDFYRLNALLAPFDWGVDVKSFELISDNLAVDKSQVYYFRMKPTTQGPAVLRGADPGSIEIIDEYFTRDKRKVFYTHGSPRPCTIVKADPKTFTALNDRYSKDEHHAFYYCSQLKDADAKTFRVTSGYIAVDSKNVYRSGRLVANADPATYGHLKHRFGNLNFYADDQRVYYFVGTVEDADPDTFEVMGSYFAKDNQHAYFCSKKCHKIAGVDLKSFRVVPASGWGNARVYARDEKKVFFCSESDETDPCTALPDADPNSFEHIERYFSKDMSNVFFRETPLEGADTATFKVRSREHHQGIHGGRDTNNVYTIRRVAWPDVYEIEIESGGTD
jgi:hypothetical protein